MPFRTGQRLAALRRLIRVSAAAAILAAAPPAPASTIGINFLGKCYFSPPESLLEPADLAGAVPQTHWNNAAASTGSLAALTDDAGSPSAASASWRGNPGYTGADTATPDGRLMRGFLSSWTDTDPTVTVSGLAALFPAGYDVLAYFDSHNGGAAPQTLETDFTIGPDLLTGRDLAGVQFSGAFVEDTGAGGNYVRFRGLTADTFSLVARARSGTGDVPTLNAIQVIHTPEPAALALLAPAFAALAARRRRIPKSP